MRADLYLSQKQYVKSRQRARELILERNVKVDGKILSKPAQEILEGEHLIEVFDPLIYVGRGGWKLEAALDRFQVSPKNRIALDIGASTGGFTDCLLQRGAQKVFAVDSGEGQLAQKLLNDDRVVSMEHTNARTLSAEQLGTRVDFIVMDVSFISATFILPQFPELLSDCGEAICLIKPQFELGKSALGKNGVVKDENLRREAVIKVFRCGQSLGLHPIGLMRSPIVGGDGNIEFLIHFSKANVKKELEEKEIPHEICGERGNQC